MAWVAPKTDWKSSDRFNISDYNRIRGNLEYLHDYVEKLYTFFSMEDLGVDNSDSRRNISSVSNRKLHHFFIILTYVLHRLSLQSSVN